MSRSLRSDFLETFGVELFVLAAGLYLFRAASLELGLVGFAEFVLARRVISLLQPVVVFGTDIALVRYVALALGDRREAGRHLTTAAVTMAVAVAVVLAVLLGLPRLSAGLLLGSESSVGLVGPLSLVVVGAALLPLCYSYLRGLGLFRLANLLQALTLGVTPVLAIHLSSGSPARALAGIGVGWVVLPAVLLTAVKPRPVIPGRGRLSAPLFQYAWKRFPGDLLLVGLLSIPPLVAANLAGQQEAAILAVGVSLVTLIGSMFAPVGQVILPAAARWTGEGRTEEVRRYALRLLAGSALVSSVGIVGVYVMSEWILTGYLALDLPDPARAALLLHTSVLAGFPYGVYMGVRRVLDAVHEAPVNAVNLGWSFAALAALLGGAVISGSGVVGVAWAFVGGSAILGLLTVRSLLRSVRDRT